jgi:hypothetical protein
MASVEWRGSGWAERERRVCAAAGEGEVGFEMVHRGVYSRGRHDDSWPPDGIRQPVELRRFFLFNWANGRSWAGGVCRHAKKTHGKAISLSCVSKKRTKKALFAVRFSKNARQRFFHKF